MVDVPHGASADTSLASHLQSDLAATSGAAKATPLTPTPDGALLTGTVIPSTGPQDQATTTLYNTLVSTTLPHALQGTGDQGYVTGLQAAQTQFDQIVTSRLPVIIAVVIAVAFLLIMTAFRSLPLAVKAAVLNLFSVGAAYGVVVAVFQFGWGRRLLGISQNVPVEAYVPMIMFAIVFGLSMDYEVFLLSRVKETWDRTRDHHEAVAAGLASTRGGVITCGALIMIAVFISFVTSTDVVIKQLAVGLARPATPSAATTTPAPRDRRRRPGTPGARPGSAADAPGGPCTRPRAPRCCPHGTPGPGGRRPAARTRPPSRTADRTRSPGTPTGPLHRGGPSNAPTLRRRSIPRPGPTSTPRAGPR